MPDLDKIRTWAQAIVDECAEYAHGPTTQAIRVTAGARLDPILADAPDGAILVLEPGEYEGPLTLSRPVVLTSSVADLGTARAVPREGQATIRSAGQTITTTGVGAHAVGLTLRSDNPDNTIWYDAGIGSILDRCVLLGNHATGQHHGFAANGKQASLIKTTVDDCYRPGQDAQAVIAWDGTDGLLIDDCYLGGGAQSFMSGGADAANADRIPKNIVIRNSTLSKNPDWRRLYGAQFKCALEVKCGIDLTFEDVILEGSGTDGSSTGYVALFTPRNQSGGAEFSTIRRVRLSRCLARYGGGGISMLGTDDEKDRKTGARHISGPLAEVTIEQLYLGPLDPVAYGGGQGRAFLFNNNPQAVTIQHVTIEGKNLNAIGYFMKTPPAGLVLRNINMTKAAAKYDWKIDGGGQGSAGLRAYAPTAVVEVTPTDPGATDYPHAA